jgi:hypothetical protein
MNPECQWYLAPDIKVKSLAVDDYELDVVVSHGIGDWPLTEADRPVISEIVRIVRRDGQPFTEDLQLDMRTVAIDAIARGGYAAMMRRIGRVWLGSGSGEGWRETAKAVRFAASEFGRTRWTEEMNEWLIRAWRHIQEHGCGTLSDLAADLGVTPNRLTAHLADLRKTHGADVVPRGRPGRKPKTETGESTKEET